jgi:hypothetical protein
VADVGGPRTCRGADEDQSQIFLKLVGEFFHGRASSVVGWVRTTLRADIDRPLVRGAYES